MSGKANNQVKIPKNVQKAWDVVAEFLNKQDELVFFIDPFGKITRERRYTLHDHKSKTVEITANSEWKYEDKEQEDDFNFED